MTAALDAVFNSVIYDPATGAEYFVRELRVTPNLELADADGNILPFLPSVAVQAAVLENAGHSMEARLLVAQADGLTWDADGRVSGGDVIHYQQFFGDTVPVNTEVAKQISANLTGAEDFIEERFDAAYVPPPPPETVANTGSVDRPATAGVGLLVAGLILFALLKPSRK